MAVQLAFSELEADKITSNPEIIELGMSADELTTSLFNHYQIERFSYTSYSPFNANYSYDTGERGQKLLNGINAVAFCDWSGSKCQLSELSKEIFEKSFIPFEFEDNDCSLYEFMAICSKVKLRNGDIKHILMLDFDTPIWEFSIDQIQNMGLPPGVILKSGTSYHYYSFELFDEKDWLKWMNQIPPKDGSILGNDETPNIYNLRLTSPQLYQGYTKQIPFVHRNFVLSGIDIAYNGLSLARGCNALRIFGYEDTIKPETPIVVAKIY